MFQDSYLDLQLQDMQEREQINNLTQAPSSRNLEERRRRENDQKSRMNNGFIVSGAPWHQQAPDTSSTADFPSIAGATTSNGNSSPALTGRWGKK